MKEKKVDIRKKNTYNQLRESLFSLLKTKPFEDIKVIDICEEANIHRSTFYYHFNDKYDFLKECFRENTEELKKELNKKAEFDYIYDYYDNLVDAYIDYVDKYKDVYLTIMHPKHASNTYSVLYEVINEEIAAKLEDFKQKGIKFNLPIKIISSFYSGGILKVTEEWLDNRDKYTKKDAADYLKLLTYNTGMIEDSFL